MINTSKKIKFKVFKNRYYQVDFKFGTVEILYNRNLL